MQVTVDVPEGGVHVPGDAAPVLHVARVGGLHPPLVGAEPPVAARPEEVGVEVVVVAPAQRRPDPRRRQAQTPDGLRAPDLHLSIEHPVVLTWGGGGGGRVSSTSTSLIHRLISTPFVVKLLGGGM